MLLLQYTQNGNYLVSCIVCSVVFEVYHHMAHFLVWTVTCSTQPGLLMQLLMIEKWSVYLYASKLTCLWFILTINDGIICINLGKCSKKWIPRVQLATLKTARQWRAIFFDCQHYSTPTMIIKLYWYKKQNIHNISK